MKRNNNFLYLVVLVSLVMRFANSDTANLSYLILAGFAFLGPSQAVQSLALAWFFTMLNPALAPEASAASIGRYLVIFSAAISVAWCNGGVVVKKLSFITLLLGVLMLIHSLSFSEVVDVSVLKVVSWLVVVVTLLSAWQGLSSERHTELFNQTQWGLIGILLLSLPLLAIPSIGYVRNGTGFQGLLNHPQAFGLAVALVGAQLGGRIVSSSKPKWSGIVFFCMCVVLVLLSEARTAGLAMVLGLISSIVLSPIFSGRKRRVLSGLHSRRMKTVVVATLISVVAFGPLLVEPLSNYIFKRSETDTLADAAEASRGILVLPMLANIDAHPLTGIGFGIASLPELFEIDRDPLLGLPLGAPIEKGVMPLAVLEELGVIGLLAVSGWLLVILRRSAQAGIAEFAVLLTLLLLNLGEFTLFSVGGMGMLQLVLMTGAITGRYQNSEFSENVRG